jgi:predicted site-specific integrase-resolvase
MWDSGTLPVRAEQMATGTIVLHMPERERAGAALYARVSGHDQKADLDRQLARLSKFAAARKLQVVESIREVGSGLNGHRKGMLRVLGNPAIDVIVVEHRDRLMRFGFEYVEAALVASGRRVLVMEEQEMTDDIVRDITELLTSMCARLYGKRSAAHRARKALQALHALHDEPHDEPIAGDAALRPTSANDVSLK